MEKRAFIKSVALGALSIPILGAGRTTQIKMELPEQAVRLAKKLQPGDTIGLIAPAGVLDDEESIAISREIFEALGFKVKEGDHIRDRYGNLAGTDQQRIADIHQMFADKTVKAIVCIRGGSGTSRLLDRLDYKMIAQNPKVLLGYSDITALILALYAKTGLVSFHGAVGISTWSTKLAAAFKRQFIDNEPVVFENPKSKGDQIVQTKDRVTTIHPGIAEGILLGGNMTVLTGLCGSPYLPDFKDKILFIEEVDEDMGRMDRMFCQLKNAGVLAAIKGFVFGKCTNCKPSGGYGSMTLDQLFNDYIKPLEIPAYTGAIIGHIADQFILPVGVRVKMDATQGTISLLEDALKD
ncbi:LD-carboxypeptidase [Sphingobacterium sp. N143]|uniref:S66 peptidase family protein n=1 Tax=Sphingobacterium sp. N143 TaxID=2746727 RepID=UPI00257601D9|nr:LD-carboxypeptidase [Sphingobacterium sp. N143]MDM1295141.1 LD-carboxypeptidase [Sphingobacterium sp. N143]